MKNKPLRYMAVAAFMAIIGQSVSAQSKLGVRSSVHLNMLKEELVASCGNGQMKETVGLIMTVKEGTGGDFVDIPWLKVNTVVGNVVVADVEIDRVDELMSMDNVLYGQLSEPEEPSMYYARMEKNANINKVHGDPEKVFGKAFLGEGVVCGLFDTGFDINHIDFYDNGDQGKSRVKRLVLYEGSSASPVLDTTDEQKIKNATVDRRDGHHGGHVLGIMAGSYRGMGQWQDFDYGADSVCHDLHQSAPTFRSHDQKTEPVAYYGAAPRAEIVLCGTRDGLYEGQQITSAQAIVDYAKKQGKPCVINHSFGSQWGPRDGSGSYGDLMDHFAEDAIICKAAGNDGSLDDYISETLTQDRKSVATILQFTRTDENLAEVEYWLSDNRPIMVELFFAGTFKVPGKVSRQWLELPFMAFEPGGEVVDLEQTGLTFRTLTPADLPEELKGAFSGKINVGMGVAAQNNRYTVDITFPKGYQNNTISYNGSTSALQLGVRIHGQPGQRVDGNSPKDYCKFSQTYSGKGADYVGGSPCMSIAEGSCCRRVIAVGSYSARTSIKYLDGHVWYTNTVGKEGGNIAPSSGYGVTVDGRALPQVAAPGVNIISAENRYYSDKDEKEVVARATVGGYTYDFIEMSGTSMACPAFAGICALWLEADPTLRYEEILDVLKHTCRRDKWTEASPERFGYGKVDAYEGLKYVLARKGAGVEAADVDGDKIIIAPLESRRYEVTVGGGERFTVTLTSISGQTVSCCQGENTVTVDASAVQPGIYVMTIMNDKFRTSKKIKI